MQYKKKEEKREERETEREKERKSRFSLGERLNAAVCRLRYGQGRKLAYFAFEIN